MDDSKYQVETKAIYINLMMLEDELTYFDHILSKGIQDIHDWIEKLRATRGVFLTLYNVKDASTKLRVQDQPEHTNKTRSLRRELEFANHVRNKGIGHLDTILLKRAVQWNPLMFVEVDKQPKELRLADAHRAVIESCINSYINNEGIQQVFGHEIDLVYPNDADEFYKYLKKLVDNSLEWISDSISILHSQIDFHTQDDIQELASVAGATNFNLKDEQVLHYSKEESKVKISRGLDKLRDEGISDDVISKLKKKYEI
jgi:hypothetical protein